MITEEIQARIAELEPQVDKAWDAFKAHEDSGKSLQQQWHEIYSELESLKTALKVMAK